MMRSKITWFEILSDLFVNLSAAWFAVVFIEPQISPHIDIPSLTFRLALAILSLVFAKHFRESARRRRK